MINLKIVATLLQKEDKLVVWRNKSFRDVVDV